MIKVTYMPSTDRKNPLDTYEGEGLGSETELKTYGFKKSAVLA